MRLPQHVSVRLCIAARSCATRAQRNVAPSYSQTWNAVIVREMSFLPDRCLKKVMHRGWAYFQARLAFTMAAFNVLVQWHGLLPNASGFVPLSIAEFSL